MFQYREVNNKRDVYILYTQEGQSAPKQIVAVLADAVLADQAAEYETRHTGEAHWVEKAVLYE